ncbi:MAG: DUF547 domain-containing protein [Deltaproteobacteria bacterium]|nr:DUF547 domain-containing protein [Deltaproteobacteria bacterium]MBM4299370.1 DUF547 domain-containing protein [Deltaproteobacteria bacterium]
MTKIFLSWGFLFLVGCAAVPRPSLVEPAAGDPPYSAWQRVLERHVDNQGRVNFAAVARERAELDRFVAWVYDNGPNNRLEKFPTKNHVLAYHLNAYNALAMHKVIEKGIPETLAGLRKIAFFFFGKVQVGGEPMSLYAYERDIIRPLGDPRIHVALNCMSVGCPRLPREPFLPERLEEQLEREAKLFFNEARNVQVDDSQRTAKYSEILDFYTVDFLLKAPSLTAYVNRYRDTPVPENYAVGFVPYDWTINRQPGN